MRPEIKLNDFEQALVAAMPPGEGEPGALLSARGLPSRRDERWKWTDLRAALREAKEPSSAADVSGDPLLALAEPLEFVFANGVMVSQPEVLPEGVRFGEAGKADRLFKENMPNIARERAASHHRLSISGTLDRPVHLRFVSEGSGMHHTSFSVDLADGAEASIVETLDGGQGAWFANGAMHYNLGEGASLERLIVQHASEDAVQVHFAHATLAARATLSQATLGFGAKLTRIETLVKHAGEGARARLNGAYLLSGKRHMDNTTDVIHAVPGCTTEELYKGVLDDRARGVFQGKFYVARNAQKTDARMAHNALLLSEAADVYAKPELEIYADDVECAHGNTAGALDDEALFYMRQRGLSEGQARALLVQAFVAEAFDHIADVEVKAQLTRLVETWLENAS